MASWDPLIKVTVQTNNSALVDMESENSRSPLPQKVDTKGVITTWQISALAGSQDYQHSTLVLEWYGGKSLGHVNINFLAVLNVESQLRNHPWGGWFLVVCNSVA